MGKYVKTTKGIYEFKEEYMSIEKALYNFLGKFVKTEKDYLFKNDVSLGEVVAKSDNADDLISEIVAIDNKNRKVRIAKFQIKRYLIEFGYRIIALTWIGDDLLKTFEWDNEKGEWKLYER